MNYLRNWRKYIPAKESLYTLLAIIAMLIIGLGYFLFVRSSIIPPLRARDALSAQLVAAERDLREAEKNKEEIPEQLRQELVAAQATLDAASSIFLSEPQAAEVLNKLYQYARESGVEITSLQNQPGPQPEEKGLYDIRAFQLQAMGDLSRLVDFVTRIKEAALKSFAITTVNITAGEGTHNLTMNIILYTSPYASGAWQPTPTADLAQLEQTLAAVWAAGDWPQAINIIRQIMAIAPNYDDMAEKLYTAYVNYGYQLLGQGDNNGAITQFNLALGIKPGGQEATAGLQQAAAIPSPTLTIEEQLAQSLHEPWAAENWEEVIRIIEQILAINPNYPGMTEKLYAAHVNYGYKLMREGQLERAKEEFTRALTIKPDGPEAIAGLQQLAGETPLPTPTSPLQYVIYVVRQGDTLYSIARRYNTTVQAIMEANGLTNYTIYVGQQLRIPTR